MGKLRWIGNAATVTQVDTITIANTWAAADTATITINGKSVTFTAAGATTADIATGLAAAFAASTEPEFLEITAAAVSSTVTLTAKAAGMPFTATSTENTVGSGTATLAHTTAASGPNFWSAAGNWDTGAVPVTGDDVYIDNSSIPIKYGLAQSAVTLASLTTNLNFTGDGCGLPKWNGGGYAEYRTDYLQVGATLVFHGVGAGQGCGRFKLDTGSAQTAIEVRGTGQSLENGLEAFLWKGTHASNTLEVQAGSVAAAAFGDEVATILTYRNVNGNVRLGAGCSITTVVGYAGTLLCESNVTTWTQYGDMDATFSGSATMGTGNIKAGTLKYNSSGTATTMNIAGVVDCSGDASARTFGTVTLSAGGNIIDPLRTIIYTNKIAVDSTVASVAAA